MFIFDETLPRSWVTAYLAEQIVKQFLLFQYSGKQLLSRMWLPAYLPQQGFEDKRESALWAKPGTCLLRLVRFIQIDPTIRTLHQPAINICAAIAAFYFVIFGWRSEAGGHAVVIKSA